MDQEDEEEEVVESYAVEEEPPRKAGAKEKGKWMNPHHLPKPIVPQPHPLTGKHFDQPASALTVHPFFAVLPLAVWDSKVDRPSELILKFRQIGGYGCQGIRYEFKTRSYLYQRMADTRRDSKDTPRFSKANAELKASIRHWAMACKTDDEVKADKQIVAGEDERNFVHQEFRYLVVPCTAHEASTIEKMEDMKLEARKAYEQQKKEGFSTAPDSEEKKLLEKDYDDVHKNVKQLVQAFWLAVQSNEYKRRSGGKWQCLNCPKYFLPTTSLSVRIFHLWWFHNYLPQPF